jgi:hypothetical protein
MKCPLCNAEIKEGSLYCEVCGEDIHIVPDFDPVIEGTHATIGNIAQDIFVNKDNNENKDNKENKDNSDEKSGEGSSENKDNADKHTVTSDTKKLSGHSVGAVTEKLLSMPKSVNYSLIGAAFAIILAVTVLAFIFFTSENYKLSKADQAYAHGEYNKASFLYYELLQKDYTNSDLQEKYANSLYANGDIENYVSVLLQIYDNPNARGNQRSEALKQLIAYYDEQGDFDNIQKLILSSGDQNLINEYQMYFVNAPIIETAEGVYQLPQLLIINADEGDKIFYNIFCTKDNFTTVVAENQEYTGSILLDEGVYDITAYCLNEKGVKSTEAHATIEIKVQPPHQPEVFPFSGEYYEPQNIEIMNYTEGTLTYYYTTDGSDPTSASTKYEGPIIMLPGVSWYKFICIDERGVSSEIVEVKYNFNIEYSLTTTQAHDRVLDYMFEKGFTAAPDGQLKEGGMVDMKLTAIISETKGDEVSYKYVFDEYIFNEHGKLTQLDNSYTVDVNTGEVEKIKN